MARLFVALWPDAGVRARLAAERGRWAWSRAARPVPDANLHVTLHFLGEVDGARIDDIAARLAVPLASFTLRLGTHALWRNGIAALEPRPDDALFAWQRALRTPLNACGLPVERRPYRPHVTLARDARGSIAPPAATIDWLVDAHALVASRPDGRYDVLASFRSSPPCAAADTGTRTPGR